MTNERNALIFLAANAPTATPGVPMQRVALGIGLSRAAMTACADRLEQRGLILRTPDPTSRPPDRPTNAAHCRTDHRNRGEPR